jgi:hypothetical protein
VQTKKLQGLKEEEGQVEGRVLALHKEKAGALSEI